MNAPVMDATPQNDARVLLNCRGLVKRFAGLTAISNVDLTVSAGEVVALVGDNGAGKSTLVQVISGAYPMDEGVIEFDGQRVDLRSPQHARNIGIETIYQDLALCDNLSPAENIFLGREATTRKLGVLPQLDNLSMREHAKRVLNDLHIRIPDLDAPVRQLSGGQRQAVAIARAVYWRAKLMIMDEPTAALGVPEQRKVIELIRLMKTRNVPVVLISHNMQDVFEVADRIFIMRRGSAVANLRVDETSPSKVVDLMVAG